MVKRTCVGPFDHIKLLLLHRKVFFFVRNNQVYVKIVVSGKGIEKGMDQLSLSLILSLMHLPYYYAWDKARICEIDKTFWQTHCSSRMRKGKVFGLNVHLWKTRKRVIFLGFQATFDIFRLFCATTSPGSSDFLLLLLLRRLFLFFTLGRK